MSSGQIFVLSIITIVMLASVIKTGIRARHGLLGGKRGRRIASDMLSQENSVLLAENDRLKGSIARLEERVAVLERIATDAPARLSAEIEKLH